MQFHVTVTAASDAAESDDVPGSTDLKDQFPTSRPHRVAVADPSSDDDQLKDDDDNADCSPWEVRRDSHIDRPPSHHSGSVPSDGVPLLSRWTGEISDVEASCRSVTQFSEEELAKLIRHNVSLDVPLQQLPCRFLQ